MEVTITPKGRPAFTLSEKQLAGEPSWTIGEQGGFKDATIPCDLAPEVTRHLMFAEVEIRDGSTLWFGDVREVTRGQLVCSGWQDRLARIPKGAAYRVAEANHWTEWSGPGENANINLEVTDDNKFKATYQKDVAYWQWSSRGMKLTLPEPVSSVRCSVSAGDFFSADYAIVISYATNWSNTWNEAYRSDGTITDQSVTMTASNITGIRAIFQRETAGTPAADRNPWMSVTVLGTSADPAYASNVIGACLDFAGSAVPLRDITANTVRVDDLWFDAGANLLDHIAGVLPQGDWRFAFEPRLDAGVWKPCAVFGPRSYDVMHTLVEDGETVICDFTGESTEGMARTIRVTYEDGRGIPRYVDVTDTDPSHYLVHKDIAKTHVVDIGFATYDQAVAIGNRALTTMSVNQITGTIAINGAPNGIRACDYKPGGVYRVVTRERGTVNVRIGEATYDGTHAAVLVTDDTSRQDALLGLMLARQARVKASFTPYRKPPMSASERRLRSTKANMTTRGDFLAKR